MILRKKIIISQLFFFILIKLKYFYIYMNSLIKILFLSYITYQVKFGYRKAMIMLILYILITKTMNESFMNNFKYENNGDIILNTISDNNESRNEILKDASMNNFEYSHELNSNDKKTTTKVNREKELIYQDGDEKKDAMNKLTKGCIKKQKLLFGLSAPNPLSIYEPCQKCVDTCTSKIELYQYGDKFEIDAKDGNCEVGEFESGKCKGIIDYNSKKLGEEKSDNDFNKGVSIYEDQEQRIDACMASCNIKDPEESNENWRTSHKQLNLYELIKDYKIIEIVENTGIPMDQDETEKQYKQRMNRVVLKLGRDIMASIGCHRIRHKEGEYDYGFYDSLNKKCTFGSKN